MDIGNTIRNLQARNFQVHQFSSGAQAASYLAEQLQGTEIGIGGSATVDSLGLYDLLGEKNTVYWHWKSSDPQVIEKANAAPVYLCSANAIAETGEIVNIDGRGNRLAGTVYGPGKQVFILAGKNKLCGDLASAIERARNVAAPRNAQRFPLKTPCKSDGSCHDCSSPDRICNAMLILMGPMGGMKSVDVLLIDEDLGY